MHKFITGRLRSITFAFKGFYLLMTTEHAIISQVAIGLVFTALGLYFGIDRMEWMMQTVAIGLVLAVESLNTAVEKICDFVHPDYHEKIGFIKDISAGAVTFAALTAFAIACMIYYPYLL